LAKELSSLLAGRNRAPLDPGQIRRATNVFLALDNKVNARYDQNSSTGFRVSFESGEEFGEIVFGPDIYPGSSVVDPNSALSLDAAAAHELTHYHRWRDMTAIRQVELKHVDEALTSLQAIFRYGQQLNETDVRLLISDAIQRLQLHVQELHEAAADLQTTTEAESEESTT
jgi:hypothetical protein